jgi:hypothetical protein
MSKKLTLSGIKESNKKFTQKKRVELSDGSHLFIYPHFSHPDKIDLIKEVMSNMVEAKELGIDLEKLNFSDWTAFNLIYKFADLGIPKDIKKKIQAFHELIKYDCFGEILNAFPQESIDGFTKTTETFQKNLDAIMEQRGIKFEDALEQASEMDQEDNTVQ